MIPRSAASAALPVLLCAVLMGAAPRDAQATVIHFSCFPVTASQVVPPSTSPGSGYGVCTLDTATNLFTWDINFNINPYGPGHTRFHYGPPGVNGPITIFASTNSPVYGSKTVTAQDAADILAGNWYYEVSSPTLPGEAAIRGQVVNAGCELVPLRCITLSGSQVVPPTASTATGTATFVLDTTANGLSQFISWSGLSGPPTAAHIHLGAAGTNGLILQTFSLSSNPIEGGGSIFELDKPKILSGQWYVDIHTALYPDGEIRAQIVDNGPCAQWTDLGHALTTNTLGPPTLMGFGTMEGGSSNDVHLFNGLQGMGITFVGATLLNAPFKGGVLVPMPLIKVSPTFISSGGQDYLTFVWPTDPAAINVKLYWQEWFLDPNEPLGVASSNGLMSIGQ